MRYWIVFWFTVLAAFTWSGSLSLAEYRGDPKLKEYFIGCFLSEKDLGNAMVLYDDERIYGPEKKVYNSGAQNLYGGYRAWNGSGGHVFFDEFQENRYLFRSDKAAANYYRSLIANNSLAKEPDKIIEGAFGDVCSVWVYPVGEPDHLDSYLTKYYILEKNLVTLIRASQKPLSSNANVFDELLKRISPYIRIALIKSSLLLKYYEISVKVNRQVPGSKRGMRVRRFIKKE